MPERWNKMNRFFMVLCVLFCIMHHSKSVVLAGSGRVVVEFCRIVADSQNYRRNTGKSTDTRLPAATKPLIIQRFLTPAKVALRQTRRRAKHQATETFARQKSSRL